MYFKYVTGSYLGGFRIQRYNRDCVVVFSESNSGNLTSNIESAAAETLNFEVPQVRAFEVGRSEFDVGR